GVQDGGEAGLDGVSVELLDGAGNIVATTTTSGDGGYSFQYLRPGTYTVRVVSATLPTDYVQTYDLDGTSSPHQATVSLGAGEARVDLDFGYRYPPTGSIGDRVWNDLDGNGVQEAGEDGVNGVTVQLLNAGGTVIATQVTSGNGNYSFTNLPAGTYSVRVVSSTLPANFIQTYDLDGTGTAHTAAVALAAGEARTDVDFGYRANPAFQPGTGTIGYWKTHPEAWPVQQITIGGVTYTKAQAIYWMDMASRGDKTIDLFKQLVATRLNVILGNDASCVSSSMYNAGSWLATNPLGSNVRSNSAAWLTGGPLHQRLDDYNNGRLCAPHRG
ncbi:MAG TPA: SdrD B-like domain-containing protein, partial [Thermoanaerobaculia bacterium]|nr:SdrD B-like domain-containing protein [Thermoanaerobaculia bacterium]